MHVSVVGLGVRYLPAALSVSAIALLLPAGCEIAVGDTVPAFTCSVEAGPMGCPTTQVCSPATNECVDKCTITPCIGDLRCEMGTGLCVATVGDASTDQPSSDGRPSDSSGGGDGGPCRSLGCKCSGDAECDSNLCVDRVAATPNLYAAAGNSSFCAQTCCSSGDCPAGDVCFATAAGTNYCVNPAWLGDRTTPGPSGRGGASCGDGSACRSGLCVGGLCADTCCSTSSTGQCASGSVCAFDYFPGPRGFDTHFGANCVPAPDGGKDYSGAQLCSANSDCVSNLCLEDAASSAMHCNDACRNSLDCTSGFSCTYILPNAGQSDTVAACFPAAGTIAVGQPCTMGGTTTCANDLCVGTTCTDPCFVDSDCPAELPHCVVTLLTVGAGGSVEAAVCGP